MPKRLPALLALVLSAPLWAQSPVLKSLPKSLQNEIANAGEFCRENQGRFSLAEHTVRSADLNGDSLPDYVLDESGYQCQGAEQLFSGTGGSQVSIWISDSAGKAVVAFVHSAFGSGIEAGSPARAYLTVGGKLCGNTQSDETRCQRPLQWQADRQEFDFVSGS